MGALEQSSAPMQTKKETNPATGMSRHLSRAACVSGCPSRDLEAAGRACAGGEHQTLTSVPMLRGPLALQRGKCGQEVGASCTCVCPEGGMAPVLGTKVYCASPTEISTISE